MMNYEEAIAALHNGERVYFHYQQKQTEFTLDTKLADLQWELNARRELQEDDIKNGAFSKIRIHELKIHSHEYTAQKSGIKSFDIRFNDRDFKVGDIVLLIESEDDKPTGRSFEKVITYISNYAQQNGYVVLSLK